MEQPAFVSNKLDNNNSGNRAFMVACHLKIPKVSKSQYSFLSAESAMSTVNQNWYGFDPCNGTWCVFHECLSTLGPIRQRNTFLCCDCTI